MQKVTKDPSLVRYYDKTAFDRPVGYDIDLRCTGAETSSSVTQNTDDTAETPYFDDYDEEAEQYFE